MTVAVGFNPRAGFTKPIRRVATVETLRHRCAMEVISNLVVRTLKRPATINGHSVTPLQSIVLTTPGCFDRHCNFYVAHPDSVFSLKKEYAMF